MRYSSKDLKAMSRTQLNGKYGIFIGAYLLYYMISFGISMVISFTGQGSSAITSIAQGNFSGSLSGVIIEFLIQFIVGLILSILMLGFNKMFLDGSRGYPVRFEDLFYGFRHHPDRIIVMQLLMSLICMACLLPGYIFLFLALYSDDSIVLLILCIAFLIVGCILYLYFTIVYSQSMFLMADYDDLGPVQALRESRKMMTGNKGRFLYLELSFMGYMFLGLLSCGIGYLWITPYMTMTQTNFYRNITGEI